MNSEAQATERRRILLAWAFARLDLAAFIAASTLIGALALFSATIILVSKGAPPGEPVGPHLSMLAHYFPGYAVTLPGAFVGAFYAGLLGAVLGFLVAAMWNVAHALLLGLARLRASLALEWMD